MIASEIGSASPERTLVFVNRGFGGEGVIEMAKRWPRDIISLHPSLVSILIGINDFPASLKTVEEFESTYDKLLAQMTAALPTTKIVLGEPFLLPVGRFKKHYAEIRLDLKSARIAYRA